MEGVCGFKCFLTHSGVDEFPCVNRAEVETALAELKVRLNSSSEVSPINHYGSTVAKFLTVHRIEKVV